MLLVLGVPQRVVMDLMGWSHTAMTLRYQHVSGQVRRDVAEQLGGLPWTRTETATETAREMMMKRTSESAGQ
jgi:hypothetical protein